MIGNGNNIVRWRNGQPHDAPKLDIVQCFWFDGSLRVKDDQAFTARGVIDGNQTLAIVEPFKFAVTHAVWLAMLHYRPLPVAHGKGLAARRKRYSIALRMQGIAIQVTTGRNEFAVALRAYARQLRIQATRSIFGRIKQVQVGACLIDEPPPIAREMARIEVLVIGMAARVLATRSTGIDVADTFII